MLSDRNTIAAISTAQGQGGIGIVRLSGNDALKIAKKICSGKITPRHVGFHNFQDESQETLDQGIVLYFSNPHSFTGEDVIEFQGHGGQAVLESILSLCIKYGAKLAEPGEFTKRAYLNNKIDLTQAESVIDVINATTLQAVKSASYSLTGKFSIKINSLLEKIISLRVYVEACIDFPEEEIDFLEQGNVIEKLHNIIAEIDAILDVAKQSELLKNGINLVLIGQPNVGKSTLLNALAGTEKAIVTKIPGTTRDLITSQISIKGIPINVIDTAGLRETEDEVEQLGINKTWEAIQTAHVAVLLVDITKGSGDYEEFILNKLPKGIKKLRIFNKIDLVTREANVENNNNEIIIYLSAKLENGIDLLKNTLIERVSDNFHQDSEQSMILARSRHTYALNNVRQSVTKALINKESSELLAEELTQAQHELSAITGDYTNDDLLGKIFSSFCIGK
ncbi:tRNA uridine-5-carboxymethylaminomethyl(34) synthesis GTPase MnmE [Methylophilaceae bacterium]|nr:tRNA uridine-5-carboxymethylaminomethyl(34) synthesis GTPase MnmE [Methylophilaceae bacterium]